MDTKKLIMTVFCLGFLFYTANSAQATEVIGLDLATQAERSSRVKINFIPAEARSLITNIETPVVVSNLSRFEQLKNKLLNRQIGPLSLQLKVNPTRLSNNAMTFNLDLVESYEMLKAGSEEQIVDDIKSVASDLLGLLILPVKAASAAPSLVRAPLDRAADAR